ncbi:MAG: tetratricopeptide repeat protein [Chloroflexota bacterium]
MLTLKLLGEATISLNAKPITGIGSRTAEALLIYLACEGRPFSRQHLAEFFWEERAPDQSAANLRAALSMLRKQVGDYLLITRQTVSFNSDRPHRLDVADFMAAAKLTADGWQQTTGLSPSANPALPLALITALDLYEGDFLAGFSLRESRAFEEWQLLKREHLQQQATLLLRHLLEQPAILQDVGRALTYARRLLRLNPFSEYAHRQKMLLLARSGDLQAALVQYQACQTLLAEEIGVEPGPETAVLAQRLQRASQTTRHNLPPSPTPFVGRVQELADLQAQLVDPHYRLLTIMGPGGAGKTRLALEAARRLIPSGYFLNGLRFVSLVDAVTPAQIPTLIAAELDLTLSGKAPPHAQLASALADEEMLLILDNLEHLMEGPAGEETAGLLAHLLTTAPLLTLLVTSRRRLQLQEEWLFDLNGLSLPAAEEGGAAGTAEIIAADAVQLFLQAAERVQRRFRPTPADLTAIVRLCRILEGLPLGIELAAGWLRHLSCAEIERQLAKSMALLATGLRNVPARQRSMTAVFDHSWALLPDRAQTILTQLAVFRGGLTAAAAAAIVGATLSDLGVLVDHSLLRSENGRYSLHDLLRHYAAERLAASGKSETLAQAHATFFLDYLNEQAQGESMRQRLAIRAEQANIRAAWETAVQYGDEPALLSAAPTLHNFYSAESRFYEGIDLFQAALTPDDRRGPADLRRAVHQPPSPLLQADLWGRVARMQTQIGQVKTASQTLEAALNALQQIDDPARQSTLLGYVAITAFYAGEFERAAALAAESLALAQQGGDQDGIAFALTFLGSCHKSLGEYAAAATCFNRAVAAYEQMGDPLGQGMALNNLGNLAQAQGDFVTAQAYYLTCSRLFQEQNHLHGAATTLANAGHLARKMGDLSRAESLLQESLQLKRRQQDGRGTAVSLIGLADVALAAGDSMTAQTYLQEGLDLAQKAGDVKLTLEGIALWGVLLYEAGDQPARAAGLLAFALTHSALTEEVRAQVVPLQGEFTPDVWETAVAWASQQTVAALVKELC